MLPSSYSILSVCVYRSARYQRACFISSTLHVYMCHSSSRRADRWCSPTRMQSHYAVQQLRLHNYPVRPAVFTRGQPGRRDSLSQGSRTCCHQTSSPPCPAARVGLAGLLDYSRGFAVPLLNLACWAICSRFHYVPGHGRRLRFPSGFWQRLLAPAQSPGEIYTSPVVCLVLSTLGRSSTPRLETLLHSRDRCARPDSLVLHTRHFDRPRPRDPRPPRVMR
jgi:hypothetical protein